jgi:hypothetical protein
LKEPQDRIDFVYYSGGGLINPRKAFTYPTKYTIPADGCAHSEWPSDHYAVVVDFDIDQGK